jgi:Core-2/I-Branching enzyme
LKYYPLFVTVVYVVISHRNPEQVLRLVRVLREGPAALVLVRHDPRWEELTTGQIEAAGAEPVEDGLKATWGGWSQVKLIVSCLREAAERHDPDWVLVLSGQDYPLRPLADIEADLHASPADARLGSVRPVETERPTAGDDEFFLRCRYRHYARPRVFPSSLPGPIRPLVYARDLPPLVGVRRIEPPPLEFHASADWLTLGRAGLRAVLTAAVDRRLTRHFRRVAVPSESFFASVLLANPALIVERDSRRFSSFAHGAPHPDTLTSEDLDRLLSSGADFARKFDATVDPRVLDMLDEHRRSRTGR